MDNDKFNILQKLRELVFLHHTNVKERIMYGGIMFSLDNDFGGLFIYKKHLSFEFSHGADMDDPKQLLEGSGKFRRHLKLREISDIIDKEAEFFILQAG